MPAQDSSSSAPFDYRPVGAVAGASLPAASLLEYIFREYPQYRKILESAEDATLPNGLVDLRKVMEKVKPGDFGLSGLQTSEDPFTNVLVQGSHVASGGPGAHGQVAGPYVRPSVNTAPAPKGEMGPPLSFLMNDRGEIYSPEMARDPKKWRKAFVDSNYDNMRGADWYGEAKERLRSRTQQLSQLKARQRAWNAYDAAVQAGNAARPPEVPRPTEQEINKLLQAKTKAVSGLKRFLGRVNEDAGKTLTGEMSRTGNRERWTPTSDSGFFGGPRTKARDFDKQLEYITGRAGRHEALAKRFDELAAKNPKFKQIAQELRMTDGELWDRMARNFEARGAKTPAQKRTIESLFAAAGGNPNALPKSQLFKPKQFETFVPSLLHGGMNTTTKALTPIEYAVRSLFHEYDDAGKNITTPSVLSSTYDAWRKGGVKGVQDNINDWLEGYKYYTNPTRDSVYAEVARELKQQPQKLVPASGDNVYKHTVAEGSSQNPRGHWRAEGATMGHKPTLWMRVKDNLRGKFTEQDFLRQARRMGNDPYAAAGAGQTAVSEVLGLNRFRRMFGRGCAGGHCGGGPARMFGRLLQGQFPGDPNTYLPNRVALSNAFEPVLVTHKAQALRDLTKGFRGRVGAGLGAIGLMGAAGYGLTGLGQGLLRSPKLPPQPKLDPHMFAKSMKLLQPHHV